MMNQTNSNKYSLVKASLDPNWDKFINASSTGTAFALSNYLGSLDCCADAFYCLKNKERMAAIALIKPRNQERDVTGHDYVIYDGLIYTDMRQLNRSQKYSERFKIQQYVAEFLMQNYRSISISLHQDVSDIRPFLWVNYGQDKPKYKIDVRYTSLLDISDFTGDSNLDYIGAYQQSSVARRQEIRYGKKKGVRTSETHDIAAFIKHYQLSMSRQGIEVSLSMKQQMYDLLEALKPSGNLFIFESKTKNGDTGSMAVFLTDTKRAYYLFGGNNPEFRSEHTGTAVIWDAMYRLNDKGITEVDLEGVNSPQRGWFKQSFGGTLAPYYRVRK